MLCYQDLLDHVLAYAGDDATATATRKHRAAVQAAYAALATRHDWVYLWTVGRIQTNGSYSTGTVAFDLTGGANERQLTLTDGTWPDWAANGYVLLDHVPYDVDTRVSDTVVTLKAANAPTQDYAAGTAFQLVRDRYPLPADFVSGDETVVNDVGAVLEYVHPRAWSSARRQSIGPGQPRTFSYIGNPTVRGSLAMVMSPPPDGIYQIDFLYRRSPRALYYEAHDTGLVTASAASTTVTGSGTAFSSRMVGSVIRFGDNNQDAPTGPHGGVPCLYERTVTGYTSPTSLTIDSAPGEDLAGVRFVVTDPADVDHVGMTEYLLRECERQYRIIARSKIDKLDEDQEYALAFTRALENDTKNTARAASLRRQYKRSGFNHYPIEFYGGP